MKIIDFLAGFLAGVIFQQEKNNKNKYINKQESSSKPSNQQKITKKYSSILTVQNNSSKPIEPDDISISTNQAPSSNENSRENKTQYKKTDKPNFIPLTIFWAHYQANQKGLLKENEPLPWEIHKKDEQNRKWRIFLNEMIDKNWPQWINDEDEVKKHALKAVSKVDR